MISVKIDDSAVQQLQQRLAGLAPRVVAQVYKALQPLIYQSLQTAVPKYFAGSAGKGGSSDLLTSRSGKEGRRPYIRPRPYLRPAINDLQQALPDLLEQAIQQVQVSE